MASLGTFCAGAYTGTYQLQGGSALALGITLNGYTITHRVHRENLDRSDVYGRTRIETFEQGLDLGISAIFHERKQAVMNIEYPWQTIGPTGAQAITLPVIGKQGTDLAGAMVLTVTAGTPAASNGPATMTITNVLLEDDFPVELLFGPEHQTFPFRGIIIPYVSSGVKFLTAT